MANTVVKKTIEVDVTSSKTKFPKYSNGSIKTTTGAWINVGKQVAIEKFVKGNTYEVEVEVTPEGYEKIIGLNETAAPTPSSTGSTTPTYEDREAAKNLRIARQGSLQAAVQALTLQVAPGELFEKARELADRMVSYIETGK